MPSPGRKPIDPLNKARRAAAVAIKRRNQLNQQVKDQRANPSTPQPRKIGKQPIPVLEQWRRQKVQAQNAIESLRHLERAAGEKAMSESALLRWLETNDYSGRAGNPGLGEIGLLFKELRRKSAKFNDVINTPASEFDQRYNDWLLANGKKGRQPQTRRQRLQELKGQIRDIEIQITNYREHLPPGENSKIELDQLRIRRRNLSFRINNTLGIRSTDPNAKQVQETFLKSAKGKRLRQAIEDLDEQISKLTEKIRRDHPSALKSTPTFAEVKQERDALLSTVNLLLENVDQRIRRQALRNLKKKPDR